MINRLPIHDAATAYKKGSGIRENAERHRTTRFTNRYDFKNFFPSFKIAEVEAFLRSEAVKVGIVLEAGDIEFLGRILRRFGRLTIGAPSSPAITNAMMFSFDQRMFEHCTARGLIYTRLVAFARDIEPSFEKSLQAKYGIAPINEILRNPGLDVKHDQEFGKPDWFF